MSAPIRQLSLSQIPVFLLNSRLGLFSAAFSQRRPFSRSYGAILPSSLTRVLPSVLGFSPRPPVSVSGTGASGLVSSFSRQREIMRFLTKFQSPSRISLHGTRTSLRSSLCAWTRLTITALALSFCVTASLMQPLAVQESPPALHRLRLSPSA